MKNEGVLQNRTNTRANLNQSDPEVKASFWNRIKDFNNNAEIGARSIPKENKFISVGQPPPQKAFSSGSSSGTEEVSSDELTPDDDIYLNPIPGSRIGHILNYRFSGIRKIFEFFF